MTDRWNGVCNCVVLLGYLSPFMFVCVLVSQASSRLPIFLSHACALTFFHQTNFGVNIRCAAIARKVMKRQLSKMYTLGMWTWI